MGCKKTSPMSSCSAISFLALFVQFVQLFAPGSSQQSPLVPAIFVFGDSIVDPGNNNERLTNAKANYPPYGKDFPGHVATGRFSNGKIPSDLLASGLGVKELLPPYLGVEPSPEDILTGFSFASGGTGFDPLTPALVSAISMPDQGKLFEEYKQKLIALAGEERSTNIVSEGLFVICSGTDDIANTYFSTPFRKLHYDVASYVNFVVSNAIAFIKQLIQSGARRIAFVGLPPVGCVPSQRTLAGGLSRECAATYNEAALLFNSEMSNEINKLSKDMPSGTKMGFLDIYPILLDLIQQPFLYGFEESTLGCCGTGTFEVTFTCNSITSSTCPDDSKYVFWDSYHPTEKAYKLLVNELLRRYLPILL